MNKKQLQKEIDEVLSKIVESLGNLKGPSSQWGVRCLEMANDSLLNIRRAIIDLELNLDDELFTTQKVFSDKLIGKAVHVKGYDINGDHWNRLYIVHNVSGDRIGLVSSNATITNLTVESFESGQLTMKILEDN